MMNKSWCCIFLVFLVAKSGIRWCLSEDMGGIRKNDSTIQHESDGVVIVETHGRSPKPLQQWTPQKTRVLELLRGYQQRNQSPRTSTYGGWLDGPKFKSTGFFRVEKICDRWWFIDPEGYLYYNVGVNAVRSGKEESSEEWVEQVTETLKRYGFNGVGKWSDTKLRQASKPLPYVVGCDVMFAFARNKNWVEDAAGTQGFPNRCMPIFHPEFESFARKYVAERLKPIIGDPYVVGIMTDNELQCPLDLLDRYLSWDVDHPIMGNGRNTTENWLKKRYGKIPDKKEITEKDRLEFIAFVFGEYYRIVTQAIREIDKNHLYLGSRLNYHQTQFFNEALWRTIAPYHDVVSVNYYGFWGPQKKHLDCWAQWGGRPILFTEWYAKAMDVPGLANTGGAGWLVRTQEDRGQYYQHFALAALEHPLVVGWHYFKFRDDPPESKRLDNAGGANKGLFDAKGEKGYQPLLTRAQQVNFQVYDLIQFLDRRANRRSF